MINRTPQSMSDNELIATIKTIVTGFGRKHGGDYEELFSAALVHATDALKTFDGRGKLKGWINWRVWNGLIDDYRKSSRFGHYLKQQNMPEETLIDQDGWDDFCRRLASEVSDDFKVVIHTAMTTPGEVIDCLVQDGWSIPRILAVLAEAREELT